MIELNLRRAALAFLAMATVLPAVADTEFRVRRMTRNDVPLGKGQCDIRLQVDNEVEVSVRGDTAFVRTIAGRDARDDGSECNEPLPNRELPGFNYEVRDSRGDIRLMSEPSRRNGYTAVVRIRDGAGGEGRYHFRLTWGTGGAFPPDRRDDPFRDDRRGGGFRWSDVVSFRGEGRGTSTLSGYGAQKLYGVVVDIDRQGRLVASFRTDSGRPLNFSGNVVASEGGRLRAEVVSDDPALRLRGPMYLSVDDRRNINSITLDAADGRNRLHLTWDRR